MGAVNQRAWAALGFGLTDDVQVVDHRPAAAGEIVGAERFVEYVQAMVELAPEYIVVSRAVLAIDERCLLGEALSVLSGPTPTS